MRIIVGGLIGRTPIGGWHYLQYMLGLSRLGHNVYYHEDTGSWPYQPVECTYTADATYSAEYLDSLFEAHAPGLRHSWHYRHLHSRSYGMKYRAFNEVARSADVFLNVGGACVIPEELSGDCVKVFIDTDPGYNQIVMSERPVWAEKVDRWVSSIRQHDRHFTYGESIHDPECKIPQLGFQWETTRPPVILELWEWIARVDPPDGGPWTTITTWNAFPGQLTYNDMEYGSKGMEFDRLLDLPSRVEVPLKIAIGGKDAPVDRVARAGWQVVDGPRATLRPADYQGFIASSRGEISAAKNVYVALRTGWFSERTTCYLASGRPAVVQDTGFSSRLPTGRGLMAFRNAEEAAVAIEEVEANYRVHAQGARSVAGECFSAEQVLKALIEDVSVGA